jgi:hypothetical protein
MTFRAREGRGQCELCSGNPAVLDFDIQCDQENSRQQGGCCPTCARHLLDALAKIKPQASERSSRQNEEPSRPART